jgi:hypothetical protein
MFFVQNFDSNANMAHVAKLGALADELVTLLTSTSSEVSSFRCVSRIPECDRHCPKHFVQCYMEVWTNANIV